MKVTHKGKGTRADAVTKETKVYYVTYRMSQGDTYYNVKYVFGEGWYVDSAFVTPMVEGLGKKMYEIAVNVLQIWLNARKQAGV